MSYKKLLVDNTVCSRRFHITFDDEATPQAKVEVKCPYCDVTIYSADNHPAVLLAREENLIKTSTLGDELVTVCAFEDKLSQKTIPQLSGKDAHVYPQAVPSSSHK
ncbi:MAG: hypothetical protein RL011_1435 [Pseudomonadota bacterium]|jgi:hypothetical protein